MRALQLILFAGAAFLLLNTGNLPAQNCEYWSDPVAISDSISDNRNATLVNIPGGSPNFYVFWNRLMEDYSSEIVYVDIYNLDVPQLVVSGNGSTVSNPQVIPLSYGNPPADSLACVFYHEFGPGGTPSIYYVVMTETGFTAPVVFAASIFVEAHLRVSLAGGIVWEQDGNILFTRLHYDNAGLYFEPYIYIDAGECRNPVIQNTDFYTHEQYIAWEKGSPDNPEIWYSMWSYENNTWGAPLLLFGDGHHSNPRFSNGLMEFSSFGFPLLVSDQIDSTGQYHISAYDFYFQDELISAFSQLISFQPDLFTIDLLTQNYWELGYLAFKNDEGNGNSTIFSSDDGILSPEFYNYCRIDNSSQVEAKPQLFQGAWHGNYFDLFCIWESRRDGPWQLFSSTTPVVIGNVPDKKDEDILKVRAYPNPVTNALWLEYETGGTTGISITIYNTFGQLVKTYSGEYSIKVKTIKSIDMNDLPAGIFLVKTIAGQNVSTVKVIKK